MGAVEVRRVWRSSLPVTKSASREVVTFVLCWVAYPVVLLASFAFAPEVGGWFWVATGVVTLAWVGSGVGLALTQRYRSTGLGIVTGVALGVITAAVLLFIALSALAEEIGYS